MFCLTINIIYITIEINFIMSDVVRALSLQIRSAITYAFISLYVVQMHSELRASLQALQNTRTA